MKSGHNNINVKPDIKCRVLKANNIEKKDIQKSKKN